jgi:hypothetical protein
VKSDLGGQVSRLEKELQAKTKSLAEATQELTVSKSLLEQQEGMLHVRNEV